MAVIRTEADERERALCASDQAGEHLFQRQIWGRQELHSAANAQGCATGSAHAAPSQSLSSRLLDHDWLPSSRRQHLEYNTNTDESSFSIFPDELRSDPAHGSMNPNRYIPAKNFVSRRGVDLFHQLDHLNARGMPPPAPIYTSMRDEQFESKSQSA